MTDVIGGNARKQLNDLVVRIERLEEEKRALSNDVKDIYAQAKSEGFDVKAIRKVIALRRVDADDRREQEAILATYMHALGMIQGDLFAPRETEAA